jgi:hypothetical protein
LLARRPVPDRFVPNPGRITAWSISARNLSRRIRFGQASAGWRQADSAGSLFGPRYRRSARLQSLSSALSGGPVRHDMWDRGRGCVLGRPSLSLGPARRKAIRLAPSTPLADQTFSLYPPRWIHGRPGEESDGPIAARSGNQAISDVVGDAERYSIGACTARIGAVALNVGGLIRIRERRVWMSGMFRCSPSGSHEPPSL